MNNLPLQPLVFQNQNPEDKRIFVEHAQGAGVFYTVYGAVDSDFGTRWHDQMEGSHGKKEGFESIEEVKHWIETDHYPSKMQPYVKPSPTWIDVNERLPSELKTVLIIYEAKLNSKPRKFMTFALREGGDWLGIDDMFGGYVFDDEYNADKFNDDLHGFNITHWMPIPEFSTMQNLHKGE